VWGAGGACAKWYGASQRSNATFLAGCARLLLLADAALLAAAGVAALPSAAPREGLEPERTLTGVREITPYNEPATVIDFFGFGFGLVLACCFLGDAGFFSCCTFGKSGQITG
jgi:hypothetical protein